MGKYIYKITNLINGKIYIGQSADPIRRFSEHCHGYNYVSLIHQAIEKYGKENPASKPIIQYDKDSNFIKEWNCITDVERKMGYSVSNISSCLRGKSNTAYGYIWKYKNAV